AAEAVDAVADHRAADGGEADADLVRAPGLELDLELGGAVPAEAAQYAEARHRLLAGQATGRRALVVGMLVIAVLVRVLVLVVLVLVRGLLVAQQHAAAIAAVRDLAGERV